MARMFPTALQVAVGGAIGATLRWALGIGLLRTLGPTSFPLPVLTANVVGSAAMGAFVVLSAQRGLSPMSPFVMTGFLGGFTTFSAFSLETVTLIERGQVGTAALYVTASVVLCVGGLWLGVVGTRAAL